MISSLPRRSARINSSSSSGHRSAGAESSDGIEFGRRDRIVEPPLVSPVSSLNNNCDDYNGQCCYQQGPFGPDGGRDCPGPPLNHAWRHCYGSWTVHNLPAGVEYLTCETCRLHGYLEKLNELREWATERTGGAIVHNPNGYSTQLCNKCAKEEIQLYWLRIQRHPVPLPAPPARRGARRSPIHWSRHVRQWPVAGGPNGGSVQDLCICDQRAVELNADKCHRCRDISFQYNTGRRDRRDNVFTNLSKGTINGTRRKAGFARERAGAHVQNPRRARGVQRACPCGKEPMVAAPTAGREYVSICLACMGVRVDPRNIPNSLRPPVVGGIVLGGTFDFERMRVRPSPVRKIERHPGARVNIESAWEADDDDENELVGFW